MVPLVALLPEVVCTQKYSIGSSDIYVAKVLAGRKHFLGTLCVVNPPPMTVAISSRSMEQVFILEGGTYEFRLSTSKKGLPKLTATHTESPVNSMYLEYCAPRDSSVRWAKFQRVQESAGFYLDPVKNLLAQFHGAVMFGSKLKLIDPSNEVVKTITVKPGGYNEETECIQSGNIITRRHPVALSQLVPC
jgi:hypothetical protein